MSKRLAPALREGVPWPSPENGEGPLLDPFRLGQSAGAPEIYYKQTFVGESQPWLEYSTQNNIGFMNRQYVASLSGGAINVPVPVAVNVDVPIVIYELVGAAVMLNNTAMVINPLDAFLVQFVRPAGDFLTNAPALGSAVVGTAGFPMKVGLSGWTLNQSGTMNVIITPRVAGIRVDIVVKAVCIQGGVNFG